MKCVTKKVFSSTAVFHLRYGWKSGLLKSNGGLFENSDLHFLSIATVNDSPDNEFAA